MTVVPKLVIDGQTPSKKNARNLLVRNGKIVNTPNSRYQAWEKQALWQLKSAEKFTDKKVKVSYFFYVQDNRKRDLDNMIASVNDALVKADIIDDDDWKHLRIEVAMGILDKENPRAEVRIEEIGEAA